MENLNGIGLVVGDQENRMEKIERYGDIRYSKEGGESLLEGG